MSQGKYSPNLPRHKQFIYNCYGKVPADWSIEIANSGVAYDEKTMFGDYDDEGYDRYGYSAFDRDGDYVGIGNGKDRNGYTEMEYLCMTAEEFEDFF